MARTNIRVNGSTVDRQRRMGASRFNRARRDADRLAVAGPRVQMNTEPTAAQEPDASLVRVSHNFHIRVHVIFERRVA